MARTQQQILDRIDALYPAVWVKKTLVDGLCVYQSIGKIFENLELELDQYVASLYYLTSTGNQVDLHAKGRGIVRGEAESDDSLISRIRNFPDQITVPALENGMNSVLTTQGAYIDEHLPEGGFADRQVFFADRDCHVYDDKFLMFTAWVPWQVDALLLNAFADRQVSFADRQQAFAEDLTNPDPSIYKRVYQALDRDRAGGIRFNMFIF